MKKFTLLLAFGTALLWFSACDSNNGSSDENFDRKVMLEFYSNNLIRPAYEELDMELGALQAILGGFQFTQDSTTLALARDQWAEAYTSWQYANAYNFGPAGEEGLNKGLNEEIGTFPASESKIEDAIAAGQWNLNDFNRDARGFLAMEYLLFGKNQTLNEVLSALLSSPNRLSYLVDLSQDLKDRVAAVRADWGNAYPGEFVNNDGTDVGSSTSLLYNNFVKSYEALKNFKVALPLGKRPGQTMPEPQLVDAYYSGLSLDMIKNDWQSTKRIWYGQTRDGQLDGAGFYEYLQSVEGGDMLISMTETQMAAVEAALNAVPSDMPLSELMAAEAPEVVALNDELQKLTRFIKSDMSSLLGIAITFDSGDGD